MSSKKLQFEDVFGVGFTCDVRHFVPSLKFVSTLFNVMCRLVCQRRS